MIIFLPQGGLAALSDDGSITVLGFSDCPQCRTRRYVFVLRGESLLCASCDTDQMYQPVEMKRCVHHAN